MPAPQSASNDQGCPEMAGVLIIAHAPFATALRECIAHVYGGLPARIGAIDVLPDSNPVDVRAAAMAEVAYLGRSNGVIVMTDMFGATPGNIAQSLLSDSVKVLAGVNLPMLMRAVCYRTIPLATLCEKALQGGHKGMSEVDATTLANPCAMVTAGKVIATSCPPSSQDNNVEPCDSRLAVH